MMHYLWSIYRQRSPWLMANMLLLAVTWLSAIGLLAASGWFIASCAMLGLGLIAGLNVLTPSTIIRGLALSRTVGRYLERVIGHEAILRVLKDLRIRVFSQVMATHPADCAVSRDADIVTRLVSDVDTLDGLPLRLFGPLFAAGCVVLACLIAAQILGGSAIAGMLAATTLLTITISMLAASRGRAHAEVLVASAAEHRLQVMEHVEALAELTALNQLPRQLKQLQAAGRHHGQALRTQETMASLGEHAVQASTALGALGVWLLGQGTLELPVLCLLVLMTLGLNEALGALPGALWRQGEAMTAARRVQALDVTSKPRVVRKIPSANPPLLQLQGLRWRGRSTTTPPLDLSLKAGSPLLVVGRSGSGKSSLLSVLAGELEPAEGQVLWRDLAPLELGASTRATEIGYLGQADHLFDVSVRDYLHLSANPHTGPGDEEALWQGLQSVELDNVLRQTGFGLDYRLGIHGENLSGGQARRLQLAALLQRHPPLILLDEPLRGLDKALAQRIIIRLQPWLMQRCSVIVTHDLSAFPTGWPVLRLE